MNEARSDNGVKSQVIIRRTDRENSGVYKCNAKNSYGVSEHIINLSVQERPDPPMMLEVMEINSRSVKLSWKQSFDGNSPILGYLVQYQPLGMDHIDWEQAGLQNVSLSSITSSIQYV